MHGTVLANIACVRIHTALDESARSGAPAISNRPNSPRAPTLITLGRGCLLPNCRHFKQPTLQPE
eukprot:7734870-Pyramimonas_sp.AAC.1